MEELKNEVVSDIKEFFATKLYSFDYHGDTGMEEYVNDAIDKLCSHVADEIEDTCHVLDGDLEDWELERLQRHCGRHINLFD